MRTNDQGPGIRRLLLAGVLAGCVAVAVSACTAPTPGPTRSSTTVAPTPSSTVRQARAVPAALQDAVFARLPKGSVSAPALTFSSATTDGAAVGDAIDTSDRTLLLAAACDGGGAVTITVSGAPDRVLDCSGAATAGPIDLSAAEGEDPPGSVSFDVRATSGSPRYLAKAVAVDSSLVH